MDPMGKMVKTLPPKKKQYIQYILILFDQFWIQTMEDSPRLI